MFLTGTIPATEASRRFSELLRAAKKGGSIVVTSHGKPVAKISPVEEEEGRVAGPAQAMLFARLRNERVVKIGRSKREDLY